MEPANPGTPHDDQDDDGRATLFNRHENCHHGNPPKFNHLLFHHRFSKNRPPGRPLSGSNRRIRTSTSMLQKRRVRTSGRWRPSRKKKILSPNSRRVLQDVADADKQLIISRTQLKMSKANKFHRRATHDFVVDKPVVDVRVDVDLEDGEMSQEKNGNMSVKKTKVLPSPATSRATSVQTRMAGQAITQKMPPQARTRLPVLDNTVKKDKPVGNVISEGLGQQLKESKVTCNYDKLPKHGQKHRESAFRPPTSTSCGRFDYWRGNVHNMNYSSMRNSYPTLQHRETIEARKKVRRRTGKSFSILTLATTTGTQWDHKKSVLASTPKRKAEPEVRELHCFICDKKGHSHTDCPEAH